MTFDSNLAHGQRWRLTVLAPGPGERIDRLDGPRQFLLQVPLALIVSTPVSEGVSPHVICGWSEIDRHEQIKLGGRGVGG